MNKKTMLAISALCAAVAFQAKADIVSSEVVGYQNKDAGFTGLHYLTSTFLDMQDSRSIQDLFQMSDNVGTGGADIQILDKDGITTAVYKWCKKGDARAQGITFGENQNGVWSVQTYTEDEETGEDVEIYSPIDQSVDLGRAVAIQLNEASTGAVLLKGLVTDADVTVTNANTGLMYIGNPFPSDVDIQDFQMDASVGTGGADLQFLDKDGITTAVYKWCKKGDPRAQGITFGEGQNGVWSIQSYTEDEETGEDVEIYSPIPSAISIAGGDAVQVNSAKNASVTIFAPFSL